MISLRKGFLQFGLIATSVLLCGCATLSNKNVVPVGTHYMQWDKRQQELNSFNQWQVAGSVSITHGAKTQIALFDWQQGIKDYEIDISSPLHIASVKITGTSEKVILWKSETEEIIAKTPENLLYRQLGLILPVSNLKYWVRGMPAPTSVGRHQVKYKFLLDRYNHLVYIEQQNWKIYYADFITLKNIDLPSKIYLQNPNVRIKMVIKQWR